MVTYTLNNDNDPDRYDIKESFEALDTLRTGRLGVDLAHTLLLGLGYMSDYKRKDEFTPTTLAEMARRIESEDTENRNSADFESGIRLETILTIVATHPALSQRNCSHSFARRSFELLDGDGKGYIDASDVVRLGDNVRKFRLNKQQQQQQQRQHSMD
mmetsp:Transcript_15538/g.33583  ORF Transcript_15538/g.33583 Transcript_15538/m.33583 type:complete len:158 (-) Transcript_15538:607-1080(-)